MKKFYLLALLLLFKCFQSSSQSWDRFSPNPTNPSITKIVSPDSIHFKGIGDHTFFRSDDGGVSWQTQQINNYTVDILFTDTLNGWIVSSSLQMLHTIDGGVSWQMQNVPGASPTFIDGNNGYCMGDTLLYATIDGGNTWTVRHTGFNSSFSNCAVTFTDTLHGWIASPYSYSILKTTDGGYTWSVFPLPLSPEYVLFGISFPDSLHGWIAMKADSLLKTTDGGLTWQIIQCPIGYASLDFKDSLVGIATQGNLIYTTLDGGASWINTFTYGGSTAFMTFSSASGFLVGHDSNNFRSTDGYTWNRLSNGFNISISPHSVYDFINQIPSRLYFADSKRGFISSGLSYLPSREIYRGGSFCTIDSGLSWKSINDHLIQVQFLSDSNIYFSKINQLNGWATCHTTDYFQTSTVVDANPGGAICFTDSLHGVYFQKYTFDGGLTWQWSTITGSTGSFTQINFINRLEGWAIDTANIFKTVDGGVNWDLAYHSHDNNYFEKIQFVNSLDGFLLRTDYYGSSRQLLRTYDGGTNWDTIPFPYRVSDFYFRDNQNGWITVPTYDLLNYGIYHTYDGGLTSVLEDTNKIDLINFISGDKGFAVGNNLFLKTDQAGIFNSIQTTQTEIDFTVYPIPSSGQINIKCQKEIKYIELFDMQGRLQYIKSFRNNDISFSKDNLNSGEYLLRVHFADQSMRSKSISLIQ